ncbi:hypothetical protein [Pseudoclavibacter terrae]|uniref:hypothetical protein n=1 Tax=Pseudoclavibacter terrae TaxID=1530195 RepID=UPI00232EB740|nr:hypothetical protein [Pseudoclavibacter terrae]
MTLDDRGRTIRMWILASVIALVLAALATWMLFPVSLDTYCGRVELGPWNCGDVSYSATGAPTSFRLWMRAAGAAIATPLAVVVVTSFVRKQRAMRAEHAPAPPADEGAQSA